MKANNKTKNMDLKESKDSSNTINLQISLEYTEVVEGKETSRKIVKLDLTASAVEKMTRSALRGAVLGISDGLKDAVSEGSDDEFEDPK